MPTLMRVLVQQAGVITLEQAVRVGVSAATVQRWTRQGVWDRVHPAVYLAGGHMFTDEARIRAAVLWAGDAAVVSGPTAAFWHGMTDKCPTHIELTVPRGTHLRPQPEIVLRRRDLLPADITTFRDVRVTDMPLTALESAIALPEGSVFLDRALQRHVRFSAVHRAYTRNLGRRGWAAAGRLITAAADRADSGAERLLVKLLREARLDGWQLGYEFGPYRIDLAFPEAKLAIEVDGWAWHVDPERFRNDRQKGNALTSGGWNLLRYTWHALDREPERTIAEIAAALRQAGGRTA